MLLNLEKNIQIIESLNLDGLNQGSTVIWLHFCSIMLPRTQSDERQVGIINRYNTWAAQRPHILASLHYMRTLTDCILSDMNDGEPTTTLWVNLKQHHDIQFSYYLDHVINVCTQNFRT